MDWRSLHEMADSLTLEEAVKRYESDPSAENIYILGLCNLTNHRNKEAMKNFVRLSELKPGSVESEWGIAEVLRRGHDLAKSKIILYKIIKENPDFAPAYLTLAYVEYLNRNFEETVKLAFKVVKMGRADIDVSSYARAYLLVAAGKGMIAHFGGPISKAINGTAVMSNIKKAQSLQPDSAGLMFSLGSYYLLAPALAGKDIDEAEKYLKMAIERDRFLADAYVRLAQVYKIKRKVDLYNSFLNKALEIDPGNELAKDIKSLKCNFICPD
jgi:tetratricopeptide (TPR) repeat protein